jgi:hypothetical protein
MTRTLSGSFPVNRDRAGVQPLDDPARHGRRKRRRSFSMAPISARKAL